MSNKLRLAEDSLIAELRLDACDDPPSIGGVNFNTSILWSALVNERLRTMELEEKQKDNRFEVMEIGETRAEDYFLDPITVFWKNQGQGRGSVTIECYNDVWNCYFGAMGDDHTIQTFFESAGNDYLQNKLDKKQVGYRKNTYLDRIITAVKAALMRKRIELVPCSTEN